MSIAVHCARATHLHNKRDLSSAEFRADFSFQFKDQSRPWTSII